MPQDSPQPAHWRDRIREGIDAFRRARYSEAASAFQSASDSNPASPVPHLCLGLAWLQQYVPGALSAAIVEHAGRAETEFRRALDVDPVNWIACVMLGFLSVQRNRLKEAREWYRKALPVAPQTADIWYTLGTTALQPWSRQGTPDHRQLLDEAILAFEKSIALDPLHDHAMQGLSLALPGRAASRDREEERREDLAAADRWLEKSADARAENVQASIARSVGRPTDPDDPETFLQYLASALLTFPPPSPPPPPPPPSFRRGRESLGPAEVRWEPAARGADQAPPPIRVAPAVQAQKLITKVNPENEPEAPAETPMRFVVVIGKDGRIGRVTLISGNIWLVQTAVEALHQWLYEPTFVDGKPVEVVTEVRVEFGAG